MGIYNEMQDVMAPSHRKEEPWGRNVNGYLAIFLSFVK